MDDLRSHILEVPRRFAFLTVFRYLHLCPSSAARHGLCYELRRVFDTYAAISKATAEFTKDDLRQLRARRFFQA